MRESFEKINSLGRGSTWLMILQAGQFSFCDANEDAGTERHGLVCRIILINFHLNTGQFILSHHISKTKKS